MKKAGCSRRCLPYATLKNESDLDLQDQVHTKNVIFKIKTRSLKQCDVEDQDQITILIFKIRSKIVPMSEGSQPLATYL